MASTIDISPYVSNSDRPIFALANLPEEVIAVLFAQYSRSSTDLRTNLAQLLAAEGEIAGVRTPPTFAIAAEKARAFHEKWVVGYGHASVAEHATIHLAAEGVSILAAKAIEDARLASFTEKSTRYVAFSRGSYVVPPELESDAAERVYRAACEDLFDAYLTLLPLVTEAVADDAEGMNVSATAIKAQAFDLLRGLLPASTKTNLGITANARTIANLVTKLLSSHLAEMRAVGEALKEEAMTVCPTLLRHAEPNAFRMEGADTIVDAIPSHAWRLEAGVTGDPFVAPSVHIRRTTPDEVSAIGEALLHGIGVDEPIGDVDAPTWMQITRRMRGPEVRKMIQAALKERGPHDPVPRAFEMANYQVIATLDYGAFRDLQRHRICSPFPGLLAPRLGFVTPAALRPEHAAIYKAAMKRAADAWKEIVTGALMGKGFTARAMSRIAQYVVPLGYNVSVMWGMNLREMIHIIELRSGKQGHPSYRRFAQDLYRELVELHPWLEGLLRVDLNDYPFARAGAK